MDFEVFAVACAGDALAWSAARVHSLKPLVVEEYLLLWDTPSLAERARVPLPCADLEFAPDGSFLAVAGPPGGVQLRSPADLQLLRTLPVESPRLALVTISADSAWVAATGWGPQPVSLWPAQGGQARSLTGHQENLLDLAFSPDGRTLAAAGDAGRLFLWDLDSGALTVQPPGPHAALEAVVFLDDETLAVGGRAFEPIAPIVHLRKR